MKNSGVTHLDPGFVEPFGVRGEWFQQSWVNISQGKPGMDSIVSMEFFPIVIAAAIWGPAQCVVTVTMKQWYRLSIQAAVNMN